MIGLAGWQLAVFSLMEVAERAGSGIPTATLARDPAFLSGLAIQVLVALLIVSVLRVIERGVELLVRACRRPSPRGKAARRGLTDPSRVVATWVGGQIGARGPPLPAFC